MPKVGDLKIYWIPQVPMKAFEYPVTSVSEAKHMLDMLARYDIFQYEHNVKPDFCNAGGLMIYEQTKDGLDWCEWYNATGESIDEAKIDFTTGEWVCEPGKIPKCSVCGEYSDDAINWSGNFCSNCGRKMSWKD
jgi:hypothetical protein